MSGNGVRTTKLTVRFPHPRCNWGPAILKVWRDDRTYSTKTNTKKNSEFSTFYTVSTTDRPPPLSQHTHQQIQKLLTFTETTELLTFPTSLIQIKTYYSLTT